MKSIYFILISIIIVCPVSIEANRFIFSSDTSFRKPDSTAAKYYLQIADSLNGDAEFDNAILYYDSAAVIFETGEDWENYIYCLSMNGYCFERTEDLDTALVIYEEAKSLILEKLDRSHISMVRILDYLSGPYWLLGDYNQAKKYLDEAITLSKFHENSSELEVIKVISHVYSSMGILKFEEAKLSDAIDNFRYSVEISIQYLDQAPEMIAQYYSNLAVVYTEKGYYDEAIDMYNQAHQLYLRKYSEHHYKLVNNYSNMAVLFSESRGDYDKALEYAEKSLSILKDKYEDLLYAIALTYYNIGEFYFKKGNYKEALRNLNKALNNYKSFFNTETHTDVAMTYNTLGEVYESMSEYEIAYEYFERALSIRLSIFGEQHAGVAKCYNNIGNIYRIQKNYDAAIRFHEKAISIHKHVFGDWNPEIAESYNMLGLVYRDKNQYDLSLQNFQSALISNVPTFSNSDFNANPDLNEILSEQKLLETLEYKAETLAMYYNEDSKGPNLLLPSFDTYIATADLIDKMRSGHKAKGSKFFLAEQSAEIFDKAIDVSMKLYYLSGDANFKKEAYFFCERSKARILQEAMNESRARNFSGIPDSLLQKEKQLKTELTFYENQLRNEKYKKGEIDSLRINDYESLVFSLNIEYQQLVNNLEQNYPRYYNSKYLNNPTEIEEVQKYLGDNEALLEYFIGKEYIYIFYFSKNLYEIITLDIEDNFKELVKLYSSSIRKVHTNEYLDYANQLYDIILKPAEHYLIGKERLIIIPDGALYYAPFEALITEITSADYNDFSQQEYLINKYDISYHYSTSFLVEALHDSSKDYNNSSLIGFAPVFSDSPNAELMENINSVDKTNNNIRLQSEFSDLRELPYSAEELKYIIELFEKKNKPAYGYFYENATKLKFQTQAGNYTYVHLATHSFVDPEKPQFSGIILSQKDDTASSTSTLYSNEIYNLDLSAELVVLSSCGSGIGKLVKGEGMMALTRGFLYAGAENIITSLWKVYDKSTSELMKSFYRSVLDDNSYSTALQEAKLKMISDNRTSHPVNWSGFVLIGR